MKIFTSLKQVLRERSSRSVAQQLGMSDQRMHAMRKAGRDVRLLDCADHAVEVKAVGNTDPKILDNVVVLLNDKEAS